MISDSFFFQWVSKLFNGDIAGTPIWETVTLCFSSVLNTMAWGICNVENKPQRFLTPSNFMKRVMDSIKNSFRTITSTITCDFRDKFLDGLFLRQFLHNSDIGFFLRWVIPVPYERKPKTSCLRSFRERDIFDLRYDWCNGRFGLFDILVHWASCITAEDNINDVW